MTPTLPGRYYRIEDGRKRLTKVFEMGDELFAVIGATAVPVSGVRWL